MSEAEQLLRQKADEAARLARERAAMEQQVHATRASMAGLQEQLTNTLSEPPSPQHLEAVRNDLQTRAEEEAILKRNWPSWRKTASKPRPNGRRPKRTAAVGSSTTGGGDREPFSQQFDYTKGEVQVERQEKAKLQEHATKLAEGVSALAEKSGGIVQRSLGTQRTSPEKSRRRCVGTQ